MQLSDLRKACRAEFGLGYDDTEDDLFSNDLLSHWLNEEHRGLAFETKSYRKSWGLDLPLGEDGISWVPLPVEVFEVISGTVRYWNGSTWRDLVYLPEEGVLGIAGPVENTSNGTPQYYYTRVGNQLTEERALALFPGSDTATVNAVRVGTYCYPVLMVENQDTPAIPPAEHTALVRRVVARMTAAQLRVQTGGSPAAYQAAQGEAMAATKAVTEAASKVKRAGPRRIHYLSEDW